MRQRRKKEQSRDKADLEGVESAQTCPNCVLVITPRTSIATPIGQQVQLLQNVFCASCSAAGGLVMRSAYVPKEQITTRKRANLILNVYGCIAVCFAQYFVPYSHPFNPK